jgi:hypothetical protein
MKSEIITELRRRCDILIEHAGPGELGTGMSGSMIRFMTALAPVGYPFTDPYAWMDAQYLEPIMTEEEFNSDIYDDLFKNLFEEAYRKVNKEK